MKGEGGEREKKRTVTMMMMTTTTTTRTLWRPENERLVSANKKGGGFGREGHTYAEDSSTKFAQRFSLFWFYSNQSTKIPPNCYSKELPDNHRPPKAIIVPHLA
eukprot:scaffold288_cov97-Cylindrotheca_fusiformis.AAC.3